MKWNLKILVSLPGLYGGVPKRGPTSMKGPTSIPVIQVWAWSSRQWACLAVSGVSAEPAADLFGLDLT